MMNKQLLEKRRRARISRSVKELKGIIFDIEQLKKPASDMEKADVLEMTVNLLQNTIGRRKLDQLVLTNDPLARAHYREGFTACTRHVLNYMTVNSFTPGVQNGMLGYLRKCLHEVDSAVSPDKEIPPPPQRKASKNGGNSCVVKRQRNISEPHLLSHNTEDNGSFTEEGERPLKCRLSPSTSMTSNSSFEPSQSIIIGGCTRDEVPSASSAESAISSNKVPICYNSCDACLQFGPIKPLDSTGNLSMGNLLRTGVRRTMHKPSAVPSAASVPQTFVEKSSSPISRFTLDPLSPAISEIKSTCSPVEAAASPPNMSHSPAQSLLGAARFSPILKIPHHSVTRQLPLYSDVPHSHAEEVTANAHVVTPFSTNIKVAQCSAAPFSVFSKFAHCSKTAHFPNASHVTCTPRTRATCSTSPPLRAQPRSHESLVATPLSPFSTAFCSPVEVFESPVAQSTQHDELSKNVTVQGDKLKLSWRPWSEG